MQSSTQVTHFHLPPFELAETILTDRPLLRTKLARALFCSPENSPLALAEVIKFAILAAENPGNPLTPSRRVDLAWHEFLLFTRTYLQFCEQQLGKFVHHEPSSDHEVNSQQYSQTLTRYRQRFGEPPAEFWGGTTDVGERGCVPASCGNCEADA